MHGGFFKIRLSWNIISPPASAPQNGIKFLIFLVTYLRSHLSIYPFIHFRIFSFTDLLIYSSTHFLAIHLFNYSSTHLPTHSLTHFPTYPFIYLPKFHTSPVYLPIFPLIRLLTCPSGQQSNNLLFINQVYNWFYVFISIHQRISQFQFPLFDC